LGVQARRVEAAQLRDARLHPRLAPLGGGGAAVGELVVAALDADHGGQLGVLAQVLLEHAVEELAQRRVGRGLGGERCGGQQRREQEPRDDALHSTLPIFFTASASLRESVSQNDWNCGASRYWIGVST